MNTNKLKGKIVEQGLNIEKVSKLIGIDKSTFYRKLHNYEKMTIGDAINLKEILNLTDKEACDIFLA